MLTENTQMQTEVSKAKDEQLLHSILEFIRQEESKEKTNKEDHYICPFCKSIHTVSNGNYKGRKRYRCNSCKKSFNDYTGTIFSHIQDMEKLNEFTRLLLLGKSTLQLAKELKISKNTSIAWKKKIMNSLIKVSSK